MLTKCNQNEKKCKKKAQNLLAMKILRYLCAVVTKKTTVFLVTTFFVDSQCFNSKTERRKKMREGRHNMPHNKQNRDSNKGLEE